MPLVLNNKFRGSLLADTARVSAPFIKVTIGDYSFGVYEEKQRSTYGANGIWRNVSFDNYPNYIQNLTIDKINGTVNTYNLNFIYPLTPDTDPNFFEKVFSSVSTTRRIIFTYGDSALPEDVYANESALITKVTTNLDVKSAKITYNVTAIGDTAVSLASQYSPVKSQMAKPSDVIKTLFNNQSYNLQEIFYGMKDKDLSMFIDGDDQRVHIPSMNNVSIMDAISKLVSYMVPTGASSNSVKQGSMYTLATYDDMTGEVGGPYFEIRKLQSDNASVNSMYSYVIDIGYPTANIVTDFSVTTNDNWSIFYDYNRSSSLTEYVQRLNSNGELEYVYNPQLTNGRFDLEANDKTWWTKVTEFPIEASITIRGLLRPAILMNYVKIDVWFYGNKHITSGVYLITGEQDTIGTGGYSTTLKLIRVSSDGEISDTGTVGVTSKSSSTVTNKEVIPSRKGNMRNFNQTQ